MATLQSGQTISIQLAEGESYTVTPSGTAQVSTRGVSGSELSAPRTLTSAQTFGPYTEAGAISIACLSGTVDYTQAGGAVYQDPTTGALVGGGGAVLLGQRLEQCARRTQVLKRMLDQVGVTYANNGSAATPSIDASSPFGRPALKLVIPNGNTWAEVQLNTLGLASFDDHVIWRVWVEDYTGIQQISAYGGTAGYARYWQNNHLISTSSTNRWNGEHQVCVGPLRAGATNTFIKGSDTFSDTKLRITPLAGADRNIWIDAVVVPARGPGIVLLTYDDGLRSWATHVQPLLANYKLRASFGFQSNLIGTNDTLYLNSADIRRLFAGGHEICPHQVSNTRYNDGTSGTQTPAQYQTDYRTCIAALRGIVGGGVVGDFHPYVQGGNNQALFDVLRAEGLRVGRGVDNLRHNFHSAGLGRGVYALKTAYLDSVAPDLATLVQAIDECATYGTTLVFMGHDFQPGATPASTLWSTEMHEQLMAYLGAAVSANRVFNLTMGEYAEVVYSAGLVERQFRLEVGA